MERRKQLVAAGGNLIVAAGGNLAVRIFVRAAGLDFEELDVWGKTTTPEFLEKYAATSSP